jgi:hypothetical protein
MNNLTAEGQNLIQSVSGRYGLSHDSAYSMLVAVNNGGGTMAQFYCPELGSGQWMRGGMTMVSDMFNHGLKNTVNNLCDELSQALATRQIFQPAPAGGNSGSNQWWPGDLGNPSSSGAQNNIRYAFFPHSRRLAVQRDGHVSVFDTQDHSIGGVSQQQGGGSSLTFTSQYGTISTLNLPLVSGPGFQPEAANNFAAPPAHPSSFTPSPGPMTPQTRSTPASGHGHADLLALLEKLGQLRDAGVLTPDEFNAKKTELLNRL